MDNLMTALVLACITLFSLMFLSVRLRTSVGGCQECEEQEGEGGRAGGPAVPVGRAPSLLAFKLCVCVFKANIGKLTVDASCKGRLRIWLIDENNAPALQPVATGRTYDADGFKIGNQTWKVDGSTCVTIKCTPQGVVAETCVNLIALALGKGAPRVVPAGTFGGPPKEPPAGATAGLAT